MSGREQDSSQRAGCLVCEAKAHQPLSFPNFAQRNSTSDAEYRLSVLVHDRIPLSKMEPCLFHHFFPMSQSVAQNHIDSIIHILLRKQIENTLKREQDPNSKALSCLLSKTTYQQSISEKVSSESSSLPTTYSQHYVHVRALRKPFSFFFFLLPSQLLPI